MRTWLWMVAAVTMIAACATPAPVVPPADTADQKFAKYLQQCREQYADVDARIEKAGVHDAEYFPVSGFPYVRVDRLMSSYRHEVAGDVNTLGTWMLQLREYDSIARDIELTNLGMPKYERADLLNTLRTCAVWLSFVETADPPTLEKLIDAADVPAPPEEIADHPAADRAAFRDPPPPAKSAVRWAVAPTDDKLDLRKLLQQASRDELGRVGLLMNQWPLLAAQHAPKLLLDDTEDDRLGAPILTDGGARVDAARAVVYYLPSYARVDGRTLIQINYFIWLGTRTLDGRVWRVTLDDNGDPLMYDTISAAGSDQLWFPRGGVHARTDRAGAVLIPQALPRGEFAVRLRPRTHEVIRLLPARNAKVRRYELRPYEDLMTLAAPGGATRSLFGADARIAGSERGLRQWTHQPVSAKRYFDDPHLIEDYFVLGGG